jgi:predicted PurR-regulated permease PerM
MLAGCPMTCRPPDTRRARLWTAAESRNVPLRAILATVALVVVVYIAAKLIYRLRDVILLMIVAGFAALILNPLVLTMQHLGIRRRDLAVSMVTLLGLPAFAGLALAFGYPLVNGITDLARGLPS